MLGTPACDRKHQAHLTQISSPVSCLQNGHNVLQGQSGPNHSASLRNFAQDVPPGGLLLDATGQRQAGCMLQSLPIGVASCENDVL